MLTPITTSPSEAIEVGWKRTTRSSKRRVATVTQGAAFSLKSRLRRRPKIWSPRVAECLTVALLISAWYCSSLVLTAANKVLLDSLSFPYPLIVTTVHFAGVALVIRTLLIVSGTNPLTVLDYRTYIRQVLPIALFAAIEIALSNQAYSMVSLSVMTVIKSTLVAATYIVSIIAGIERFDFRLAAILFWIIGSVAFSVPGMEVQNGFGVVVLSFAVICGAFRWVSVHQALRHNHMSSLDLICLTQPLAALCLLPAALTYDMPDMIENLAVEAVDSQRVCAILALIMLAVVLVCTLMYCEFKLIELTSSLTLTVGGVGKECLTIGMSTLLFKETLSWKALVGLVSSIAGISAYIYTRSALSVVVDGVPAESDEELAGVVGSRPPPLTPSFQVPVGFVATGKGEGGSGGSSTLSDDDAEEEEQRELSIG
eukprot:Protomagalhaensia_sp_Gyna_25__559@NODE_1262_length_2007_cov_121_210874_g1005_i0_p1_GENE_NODE_1262_length_2007_cov_121_210874_g1005_i0NODE_1262_length_2007_cov_121_210874_g1005_i0_p1_ORF_typecomplete_len427_score59_76TPT/PF03151_16/3_3e51UAA/PF08449_11/3_9e15EamA/PF00892_20/2_1EamA/PF00892_20/5_6e07PUNUT/PF16913_5/0_0036SLC35F/PF06027_12/1_3e03SLC35F/PF06027_12/0_14_NODE_1262_length_2007_cov_121_210874_g1005_i06571937